MVKKMKSQLEGKHPQNTKLIKDLIPEFMRKLSKTHKTQQ